MVCLETILGEVAAVTSEASRSSLMVIDTQALKLKVKNEEGTEEQNPKTVKLCHNSGEKVSLVPWLKA